MLGCGTGYLAYKYSLTLISLNFPTHPFTTPPRYFAHSSAIAVSLFGATAALGSLGGEGSRMSPRALLYARLSLALAGFTLQRRLDVWRGAGDGCSSWGAVGWLLAAQDYLAAPLMPLERFLTKNRYLIIGLRYNL